MKVKRIGLNDEEMPESVLVELSHDEAAYLALLIGKQSGKDAEQTVTGGSSLSTAVYEGLTFGVFNRFYEDGIEGAASAMRTRK
ncbi:hypothetical protein [Streptomyces sp. FxanaA7]|uniref:hypothetical protein n=1 Tax=Streptomyces sp. FxanaA7 TaxID=1265492 RepID=UPI0005EF2123|nr:hypothetical protein [Streptomyces sp. FxanaA7]